jgi:hypothetical protein
MLSLDFSSVVALWHYMGSLATSPAYSIRSSAISISRKDVSTGPRVCLCPSIIRAPRNLACNESICDVMAAKRPSGLVRVCFIKPSLRANEEPRPNPLTAYCPKRQIRHGNAEADRLTHTINLLLTLMQ